MDAEGQALVESWVPSSESYDIGEERNVDVPMEDGVKLRVDVKYPIDRATGMRAVGPFPSVLTQTPYGKNGLLGTGSGDYLVKRGYIAVIADVRGRGASQGEFEFWGAQERLDGVALARWASELPNANGRVGLYGASYLGVTQLLTIAAAGSNSPIRAAVPEVAASDVGRDLFYGGMPNFALGLLYAALFPATGALAVVDYIGLNDPVDLTTRTLESVTGSLGYSGQLLLDMALDGPAAHAGEFWDPKSPGNFLEDIAASGVPIMIVDGWYDIMGKGPSMNYVGLQNLAVGRPKGVAMLPNQPVDGRYQWVQGPWTHTGTDNELVSQIRLRWFDRWLKDIDNGVDKTATPIHFNVLGSDRWIDASAWPLKEATSTVMYFGGGRIGSGTPSLNDGLLSSTPPVEADASDTVVWTGVSSPCNVRLRVQTMGLLDTIPVPLDEKICGSGSNTSREVAALTYTTEPFKTEKIVAGPIGLELFASSSRVDAEFIVDVSRVTADGSSISVGMGALLGSQRSQNTSLSWYDENGAPVQPFHYFLIDSGKPLEPGVVTRFEIGVWPTAFQINEGERLRITIATSDIPFSMPLYPTVLDLVGGVYEVQRSSVYPSSVTLPIADPSSFERDCVICVVK